MRKRYPRKSKQKKLEGYYITTRELVTCSTLAVDRQIPSLVLDVINSARVSLCLAYFQFTLNGKKFRGLPLALYSSLKSRQLDGVDVKVLLNQKFSNYFQWKLNRQTHKILKQSNIQVKFANPSSVVHTKLIIVDGYKALIGSANLTMTSFFDNWEVVVLVKSDLIRELLVPYFNKLWEGA